MWRIIAYAIGIIFQIVILILMIKESRKNRRMRKTQEYLIDELKKRKSEAENDRV